MAVEIMRLTIYGDPKTKKNSPRILWDPRTRRRFIAPSEAYMTYERNSLAQLPIYRRLGLSGPMNLCAVYYMQTHRVVDLANLLSATCDILVAGGVIADDNSKVVATHDGSKVLYDKENPRVEITIEEART